MNTIRGVAVLVVIAILMLLLAGWLTLPAQSHEWYTKTHDPMNGYRCCGGQDCAPVDPAWVSETKDGYRLTMTVEQARTINPITTEPVDAVIPWSRVQTPPNATHAFYACIWEHNRKPEDGSGVICFFATPTM